MKPIKLKDLLLEASENDYEYQSDVETVKTAIKNLQNALMALEAGNYHSDKPHAQTVITSLRERADAIKRLLKTAYMDKYYNK